MRFRSRKIAGMLFVRSCHTRVAKIPKSNIEDMETKQIEVERGENQENMRNGWSCPRDGLSSKPMGGLL